MCGSGSGNPRGCSGFGAGCGCRDAAACNAGRDLEAGTDAADGEKFVCGMTVCWEEVAGRLSGLGVKKSL